jgi:flagellar motor switch/type III secretory pathway protein FliN
MNPMLYFPFSPLDYKPSDELIGKVLRNVMRWADSWFLPGVELTWTKKIEAVETSEATISILDNQHLLASCNDKLLIDLLVGDIEINNEQSEMLLIKAFSDLFLGYSEYQPVSIALSKESRVKLNGSVKLFVNGTFLMDIPVIYFKEKNHENLKMLTNNIDGIPVDIGYEKVLMLECKLKNIEVSVQQLLELNEGQVIWSNNRIEDEFELFSSNKKLGKAYLVRKKLSRSVVIN